MPLSARTALRPGARALLALAVVLLEGCERASVARRALAEIEHVGFRDDVPESARGNAVFIDAWWSDDGALLVTAHHLATGLRVWDGRDGRLISKLDASPPEGELLVDGARKRIVAHRGGSDTLELGVFDALDGRLLASAPDDRDAPAALIGWTDGGAAFVATRPAGIEVLSSDDLRVLRRLELPADASRYRPTGALLAGSYNDKRTIELSTSGARLARATAVYDGGQRWFFELVELREMSVVSLESPSPQAGFASFAFSRDERLLALGLSDGLWLYDIAERAFVRQVQISGRRNKFIAPMAFTAGDRRIVALCDQLEVLTLDVATGEVIGQHAAPFEDWEGVFRVSADGSRAALYHFTSDTIEILDGADARRIGWVCAYFCNHLHNPVRVHFELSPDGKTLAAAHRYGAALWSTDEDRLLAPLNDPALAPVRPR